MIAAVAVATRIAPKMRVVLLRTAPQTVVTDVITPTVMLCRAGPASPDYARMAIAIADAARRTPLVAGEEAALSRTARNPDARSATMKTETKPVVRGNSTTISCDKIQLRKRGP